MGSAESRFNVPITVRGKAAISTVSIHKSQKGEPRRSRTKVLLLISKMGSNESRFNVPLTGGGGDNWGGGITGGEGGVRATISTVSIHKPHN